MSYILPRWVQDTYDRIEGAAGAIGPFGEGRWASQERNNYEVGPNESHKGLRLGRGNFVGIHHPANGVAVDNLLVEDFLVDGSRKWGSRPYEYRTNVTYHRVTFIGVLEEHGFYPTMIGWGTYPDEKPAKGTPSLILEGVRYEHVGSQAFQLTGPRHLKGQQVGTAPNGTGFRFEDADTWGGPIRIFDNYARDVCTWGTRPAFAYSFREAKHHVNVNGMVLDNRGFNGWGGALFQGSKDFMRHAAVEHMLILQGNSRYAPVQVEDWGRFRMRNCAVYAANEKPMFIINPRGPVLIEECEGNVDVVLSTRTQTKLLGKITDRIEL